MKAGRVLPPVPEGLDGDSALAWGAMARAIAQVRDVTAADSLRIEGAARAWARWRMMESKIAEVGARNPLAGEIAKSSSGALQASAMRQAATQALAEYRSIASELGLDAPADLTEIDLFGYPDRPGRGKVGRPRFVPTMRDRNKVRLLLALGWATPRIASALEISVPTLNKRFSIEMRERDLMRDRLDARRIELAMDQANAGNISALRELNRMLEDNDRMTKSRRVQDDDDEIDEAQSPVKRGGYIGKKGLATDAAQAALSMDPDLQPGRGSKAH